MAKAVVDLGSRRRTLLFLRADQLGHFVSCLVYLPRDRYTTAVRLQMQDILVREFGGDQHRIHRPGQRITLGRGAFHGSAAGRHPAHARSTPREANRARIQALLTEAARTWADRLIGAGADRLDRPRRRPSTTPRPSPRSTSRPSRPTTRSTTSRSSKSCRTIRSSWCSPKATSDEHRAADLVSRRAVRVAEPAAADAAEHGRRWCSRSGRSP